MCVKKYDQQNNLTFNDCCMLQYFMHSMQCGKNLKFAAVHFKQISHLPDHALAAHQMHITGLVKG